MKTASVVITTKNRREELLRAVESAIAQRGLLEVVVIDDGSTDGSAADVERIIAENGLLIADSGRNQLIDSAEGAKTLDPRPSTLDPQPAAKPLLRLIRHEVSEGYIVRRNEGARLAKGDVIFSLDDDAVFSSPFVVEQTLQDFSHPRIGAVAIPYIEPHKANKEMQRAPTGEDIWITASYIGTAHAVRRDVFLALGGYREHLVHQGEEGDFCLRMLAADAAQLMTDSGGRKTERDLFNHGGHREHGGLVCSEAGLRSGSRAGDAFSNPSISKLARDSENTSLTRCAGGPALERIAPEGSGSGGGNQIADSAEGAKALDSGRSIASAAPATLTSDATFGRLPRAIPCAGGLDSAPLSAVQGFFVRLGNSDPIIHNESPKRDYSRMDFYGRRNDVLFHWQNTPTPDLLWQLPMTIAGGLVCAAKVGRWRKMLQGIFAGFVSIAGGAQREPVSGDIAQTFKSLKKSNLQLR